MKTTENGQRIDVCDICQQKSLVRKLANDHDHSNGQRRGQLCGRCNMGLGHFKNEVRDNEELHLETLTASQAESAPDWPPKG